MNACTADAFAPPVLSSYRHRRSYNSRLRESSSPRRITGKRPCRSAYTGTAGAGHNDGRGRRGAERAVRRSRGPGGRRSDSRQRAGDRGLSQGTAAPPAHQLLHRVAGGRGPVGRPGGHTVRRAVQRRAAPSPAPVHVLRVANNRPVHSVHTQPGGRVRRPVLGHTLPDGLLHELEHQNRNQ